MKNKLPTLVQSLIFTAILIAGLYFFSDFFADMTTPVIFAWVVGFLVVTAAFGHLVDTRAQARKSPPAH